MTKTERILTAVIILLAISNVYFITESFVSKIEIKANEKVIKSRQFNEKVVSFTKLFLDKVLSGQPEVSFEDRLLLENAVRDLNDKEIFNQWQIFVKSGTGEEGQTNLSWLLKLLMKKITY